jgi:ribosomal protein L3 glutamine methyltransferase
VEERIQGLAQRRANERKPLAYLLGECRYMGLKFWIQEGVLVPRSPIGYLLHDGLTPWLPSDVRSVIDLCAGSGCLGIVAAYRWPEARVTLVELSEQACEVAQRNIALHDLGDRVEVVRADVKDWQPKRPADVVIANPPYVDAKNMRGLAQEFAHEPVDALQAGQDGLDVIAPIVERRHRLVAENGLLIGEVGASEPALVDRFKDLPFIWADLPDGGIGVFILSI